MFANGFKGKNVLVGLTGGIAIYKVCELIRKFKNSGANVKVILSKGAEKFVTPLLFASLSGQKAYTEEDFFKPTGEILHIELANFPDVVVIAPATASFIAKLASGQADELLLSTLLATKAPVYIFPAMNTNMWEHPATQRNIEILKTWGYRIYEPASGILACDTTGKGRLPEVEEIFETLQAHFVKKTLLNHKVLITGGPTKEYIDEVRCITNDSSGKMAFLLAKEAYYRGAEVYLIWGGKDLPGVFPRINEFLGIPYPKVFPVSTTKEMLEVAKRIFPKCRLAIFAAAPCDFRPKTAFKGKLKKQEVLTLDLELTEDIAKTLSSQKKPDQITIGFALENPENLEKYALTKKQEKNFDLIVANPISTLSAEISDFIVFTPKDKLYFNQVSKDYLAKVLFDLVGV
ncbi:bifunctional phosphopantothenoylcysteine decarboxylase/phosphopantothenate--cysteine ligase CoaBC [Thermodesulfobacterium sp. TA1]|uniref:bifunctional phosphopantothenoylcysteine decarboxylase/phosphopantothenate--cysteine ligase CoaBC n=1 Tax=Thermodesulfobacterium sp. TA1 TaxID=2234087 RepID=UPI00143E015F|nr:bifunctional phosphopantothenoylcysteine decarboxylase/phosphopantothenate--cysteine ligase CoaBC [Thermodesulfobacterium sp. TA1]